ncbi:hypothetical protein Mycch_0645 [Mycolicibacterium chubuense NBB4]|uniref:Uncharacterized protein n=1 Tax=Mycolicibacterium chubuense (strain NBB4) TaxID=710421 RepID=I4BDV6_MYCCN|nr:hypothetical protein [Mycolicibacterium chubuense]AFM15463.1 hypothetical protein Mycch_0645 [Mycolicibacterium chubuense NBB4]
MRRKLPSRLRGRRRLLVWSTPPALIVLAVAVKLISVVLIGHSAQSHYASGAIGALGEDVSLLRIADVIEPANTSFAAGDLAVLQDRLDVADTQFARAVAGVDVAESCPARVNLELVRERRGDIDAWEARLDTARTNYESALSVITGAPGGCFAGNQDPDPARRAIREDAAARIAAKLGALGRVAPLAPPLSAPPAGVAAPAAPPVTAAEPDRPPRELRLDPTAGDPLDALRRLLRDAATG